MKKGTPLVERFWAKVDRRGPDECWHWTAAMRPNGYGRFRAAGQYSAHRVSWVINRGPIPDGLLVCHKCDNRACVNPNHLFLGDYVDNAADMCVKGRALNQKVFAKDLPDIWNRFRSGERRASIARAYGVHRTVINYIINGRRWGHYKVPL